MSDFDFFKELGNKIDSERRHHEEFNEMDWLDLKNRLDANDLHGKRRRRLVAWLLPLLVAVGFGGLGSAFWQAERRADDFQNEITELKTALAERKMAVDTVFKKVTVVQFDTIFNTVVIRREVRENWGSESDFEKSTTKAAGSFSKKEIERAILFLAGKSAESQPSNLAENQAQNISKTERDGSTDGFQKKADAAPSIEISNKNAEKQSASLNLLEKTADSTAFVQAEILSKKWAAPLAMLPMIDPKPLNFHRKKQLPDLGLTMSPAPRDKKEVIIQRFRPHVFAVGIRGGLVFPNSEKAEHSTSFTGGLAGEMSVGSHFSLLAAADYMKANFKVYPNEFGATDIPLPTPPSQDDMLVFVKVEQPAFDFSVGLRYDFLTRKPFKPFASAAFVGELTREQRLQYGYKNNITEEETALLISRYESHFNTRGLQFGLGADWFFRKNWSFSAEAIYQKQFTTPVPLMSQRFAVRAGLKYYF